LLSGVSCALAGALHSINCRSKANDRRPLAAVRTSFTFIPWLVGFDA
jgi:hypothetical protein